MRKDLVNGKSFQAETKENPNPFHEPPQFSGPKSRSWKKRGMARASTGTIRTTRNMINRVVRKRNRNRVTAIAARKAINAETMTALPATTGPLTKQRPNSCRPKTRRKESGEGERVHARSRSGSIHDDRPRRPLGGRPPRPPGETAHRIHDGHSSSPCRRGNR